MTRTTSYPDRLRSYKVKVDGKTLGKLAAKASKEFPLEPGAHRIWVTTDWCGSNIVDVEVKDGHALIMECGSSLTGWRVILSPFYIFFLPGRYLWLRMVWQD